MLGLVSRAEQARIVEKLIAYYKQLYPGVDFTREELELSAKEIGNLLYTYAGTEEEASAREKMIAISKAIKWGYDTPIVILRKPRQGKDILLDGHRRARFAFENGMGWKAVALVPNVEFEFGVERTILGRIADLYSK